MRGRTTIVITHRLTLAQRADRIIVMAGGRIAEQGTPAELMAKGEAFTALFAVGDAGRPGAAGTSGGAVSQRQRA
jgi:ABC-type multidrug transport system fused ATPase/permease subunit